MLSIVLLPAAFAWLWFRPNRAEIDLRLRLEVWDAVADGLRNSNTDMILWQGDCWLAPDVRLVVRRSRDGREICCQGTVLRLRIFHDKNPHVRPGAIVENKRLAAVLSKIRDDQHARDRRRLASLRRSLRD
jgi:hypothetical protein